MVKVPRTAGGGAGWGATLPLWPDPRHRAAREAQVSALEMLIERSGGENFSEVQYLTTELDLARTALSGDASGGSA